MRGGVGVVGCRGICPPLLAANPPSSQIFANPYWAFARAFVDAFSNATRWSHFAETLLTARTALSQWAEPETIQLMKRPFRLTPYRAVGFVSSAPSASVTRFPALLRDRASFLFSGGLALRRRAATMLCQTGSCSPRLFPNEVFGIVALDHRRAAPIRRRRAFDRGAGCRRLRHRALHIGLSGTAIRCSFFGVCAAAPATR